MNPSDLRLCRSVLFLPASNARAIEKARLLDADAIILDLEDAVKPEDKAMARTAAVQAAAEGFGGRPVAIRINMTDSAFFGEDIVAVRHCAANFIVLPKAENRKQVHDAGWLTGKPILAMIETSAGVIAASDIAPGTSGLIAGTNDLSADLGIPASGGRRGLAYCLQAVVVAARASRVAAFDGVYNRLEDDKGLAEQCEEGKAYGFDGKSIIHPSQIATANRIFGPSAEDVEAARELIAAATGGAERYDGRMIEAMHVAQAEAVLAKAHR